MDLNNSNKRLAKNTIILNIRLIVTLFISFYSSRLVLKVLGVEDYGLYNLVGGFVSLLAIITSSITGAASRFITVELGRGNIGVLNSTFCSIVNVLMFFSFCVAVFAALFGPWFIVNYLTIPPSKINIAIFVFGCSVFVFVLNMLSVPYTALVTAHEHMDFYAVMSVYDSVSKLMIVILLSYFGEQKLLLYAFLLASAALINRLIYGAYCMRKFQEAKYHFIVDKTKIKQVLSFSFWMGIGSAAGILKDQAGNVIINMFFGLLLNASMGIATQIKGIIVQFGNSIGAAITPQITKSFAVNDFNRSIQLTYLYVKVVSLFMLIIAMPFLFETPFILKTWLNIVPNYSVEFVRIMIIVTFLNTISQGFGPLFLANGKIRTYQIIGACIVITYVPLCYLILCNLRNPLVCLLVSLGMEVILLFSNYYCLKVQIGFPILDFFKNVIGKIFVIVLLSGLFLIMLQLLMKDTSLLRAISTLLLSTVIIMISSFFLLFNNEDRKKILKAILKKTNYGSRINI